MPGSGQWKMLTGQRDIDDRCWMCDLHKYSLVFWTREIGVNNSSQVSNQMAFDEFTDDLDKQEKKINVNCLKNVPRAGMKDLLEAPIIYGSFNNWKGQEMFRVEDFSYLMDLNKEDLLKRLKNN